MADAYEAVEDLIKAHRPRLDRVALKLGRGVPEIGKELWEYLKGLSRSLSQQERAEALETALKKLETEAVRSERRKTRSGTSDVERYGRILADRADDVEKALRRKNVKQIDRAASVAGRPWQTWRRPSRLRERRREHQPKTRKRQWKKLGHQ